MLVPPTFSSQSEQIARIGDVAFWRPYVAAILERHGLAGAGDEVAAGFNATYPTFLHGDLVVKLFGGTRAWQAIYATERAALALVATDEAILAPRLIAAGELFAGGEALWPYLVIRRVPGVAAWRAKLSAEQWRALAVDLGEQVRRIHALPATGIAEEITLQPGEIEAAAMRSSLPPHLAAQAAGYAALLEPSAADRVVVHGDLVQNHAYVADGRLVGIIDWGDAMVTDRHYEIIQIYRDMFACDAALLRVFLDAYGWPRDAGFPRKALGHALRRQAIGLGQHHTMDVFQPIAARLPLREIATLDDLATRLFAV
jgi:aminoglycoside phosphotransferase (APT) family kinase protein